MHLILGLILSLLCESAVAATPQSAAALTDWARSSVRNAEQEQQRQQLYQRLNPTETLRFAVAEPPQRVFSLVRWLLVQLEKSQAEPLPPNIPKYDRRLHFGGWVNEDPKLNCFDTRAEVLLRDRDPSVPVKFDPKNFCEVASGAWLDPYSNRVFKTAQSIHVDHVVPLKNAYYSGAFEWRQATRCHFANFLRNDYHLLAVSGRENMSKNDRDPSEYLPPNRRLWCSYIKNWMKIKMIWDLRVTEEEVEGIRRATVAAKCRSQDQVIEEAEFKEQRSEALRPTQACLNRQPTPNAPFY